MELSQDLDTDLNTLIKEHGLLSVLESLKELVGARADLISDSDIGQENQQAEAFRDVTRALTVLIKALPRELDIEIALEQLTHTSAAPQLNSEPLA